MVSGRSRERLNVGMTSEMCIQEFSSGESLSDLFIDSGEPSEIFLYRPVGQNLLASGSSQPAAEVIVVPEARYLFSHVGRVAWLKKQAIYFIVNQIGKGTDARGNYWNPVAHCLSA